MDQNAMAIVALCSHLCMDDAAKPLEPREWSALAARLLERSMQPSGLFGQSAEDLRQQLSLDLGQSERFQRLLDRSGSLSFELSRYEAMGIRAVTRADADYPRKLKRKLANGCPPLFYCAGDMRLLDKPSVGYAGSRSIGQKDLNFTIRTVHAAAENGYQVVTGGAKGVDQAAEQAALRTGGSAVAYLCDSMLRKIKGREALSAIQEGRLLLLSVVKPDAGFNTGVAMMRNRYVYAQSDGVVVVKSDHKKGGTWNGALENLRHNWCRTLCWENPAYPGNMALIEAGATPIGEDWDGDPAYGESDVQLSLFKS